MRRFVRQCALFSTLCLALLLTIEIPVQINYSNRTHWQDDWAEMASSYRDVLLIGNSRAWTGFDAPNLSDCTAKNCYTVALDGWNAQFLIEKCKYHLKNQQPPTHIVVQLDPSMTFERLGWHGKNKLLKHLFLDRLNTFSFSSTLEGHRNLDFFLPGFRYFGNHKAYFRDISISVEKPDRKNAYDSLRLGFNPYFAKKGPLSPSPKHTIWNETQTNRMFKRIDALTSLFPNAQVLFIYPPTSEALHQLSPIEPFKLYAKSQKRPFLDMSNQFEDSKMYDHTHCSNLVTDIIADSLCLWINTNSEALQ